MSNLLPDTLNALSAFLQRSACPLTSLALSFANSSESEGDELLSFLKRLSLAADTSESYDSAAQVANFHDRHSQLGDVFLPHLQKLKCSGKVHVPLAIFLDIMENRRTISLTENCHVSALEELAIHAWSLTEEATLISKDDLQWILDLRAASKTVSVLWSRHPTNSDVVDSVEEAMKVFGLGNN